MGVNVTSMSPRLSLSTPGVYGYLILACPVAMGVNVMGDSFIANFKDFFKRNFGRIHLREVMIQYSSKRGGTVEKLQIHQLQEFVCLQIGTNDLCDGAKSPGSVARSI